MKEPVKKPGPPGEPHDVNDVTERAQELFWRRVKIGTEDECWEHSGTPMNSGYVTFTYRIKADGRKRYITAHRFSALLKYGAITNEYCVLHSCDNKLCVNPNHLSLGTQQDNMLDMHRKGRAVRTCNWGEQNGYSKLTDDQVRWIMDNHYVIPQRKMAEQLGVHHSTIERIHSGRGWQHLRS